MKRAKMWIPAVLAFVLVTTANTVRAQEARAHGSVVDEAGQPIAKVKVVLEPIPGAGGNRTYAVSNAKGKFLMGIVRPGMYQVVLDVPGRILIAVKARAADVEKQEAWSVEGRVQPGVPPKIHLGDGFDATLDLTLGRAVEVTSGSGAATQMTPEQALAEASTLVQNGDCASAIPRIDAILGVNPGIASAHYLRGYCLGLEGKDSEAVAALGRALELEPKFEGAALSKGQILRRLGSADEAVAMLKQELAITQNPQLRSEALITLGLLYEDQGKDGDALDAFQQVASLMPERPEPYLEMAAIHTRLGNPERAAAVLEQARKMGASSPEALLNIGISYFNRKDYGKADEMFRQVLSTPGAATADQAMAQALVGKLLLRDGKVEEAVAAMKRSLELDPNGRLAEETKDTLKALNR